MDVKVTITKEVAEALGIPIPRIGFRGQATMNIGVLDTETAQKFAHRRLRIATYRESHASFGGITYDDIVFDHVPTSAEIQEIMAQCVYDHEVLTEEFRQRREAKQQQEAEIKRQREEAAEAKRQALFNIEWDEQGYAVHDLYDAIVAVAGDKQDSRFEKNWVKTVTAIDPEKSGGYMFEGDFVKQGTQRVKRERQIFLVASTSGSRKSPTTTYRVVIMNEQGELHLTAIVTTDDKPGWALRLQKRIAQMLELRISVETVDVTMTREAYERLLVLAAGQNINDYIMTLEPAEW